MTASQQFLDVLTPPPAMVGHSAVWVAPLATEVFLDAMMTRFTGLHGKERGRLGCMQVFGLHDPMGSEERPHVFACNSVPGHYDMQPASKAPVPMQARLLLMAFSKTRTGAPAHVRLVVFTGDLTHSSAQASLALAWRIDVSLTQKRDASDCADMAAAAAFVKSLIDARYLRPDGAARPNARTVTQRLDTLLACCARVGAASKAKRFFATLREPLFDTVDKRLRQTMKAREGMVLCASPAFASRGATAWPAVQTWLSARAHKTSRKVVLISKTEVDANAHWVEAQQEGWDCHLAADAMDLDRVLNANYVYVGRPGAKGLKQGWLCMTSANLNDAIGIEHAACGVMFPVPALPDDKDVTTRLLWDPSSAVLDAATLTVAQPAGMDAMEQGPLQAAPVLLAQAVKREGNLALRMAWRKDFPKNGAVSVQWAGQPWTPVERKQDLIVASGTVPAVVEVRAEPNGATWVVPGVNLKGRVCLADEPCESFDDALDALLNFPPQLGDAAEDDDEDEESSERRPRTARPGHGEPKVHALQTAAEFLEKVASVQTQLEETALDDWLDHLDRVLTHALPVPLLDAWRTHRFDFVTPLTAPTLAPARMTPNQKQRYVTILKSALSWGAP